MPFTLRPYRRLPPCAEPSAIILGLTRALAGADIRGCCGRGKGRKV